jgi:hypothetical protein
MTKEQNTQHPAELRSLVERASICVGVPSYYHAALLAEYDCLAALAADQGPAPQSAGAPAPAPQGIEALADAIEALPMPGRDRCWRPRDAFNAGFRAAVEDAAKLVRAAVPAAPTEPTDSLREALALLMDVYDAMGAPRGPARIRAEVALAAANDDKRALHEISTRCLAAEARVRELEALAAAPIQPEPAGFPKDHEIAQAINSLRDIAIKYHATQQLRERIVGVVVPLVRRQPAQPSPPTGAEPLNSAGETSTQHAHRWAIELAVSLAKKHYPEAPHFQPLPDLLGVITQIDNMTTGLCRAPAPIPSACVGDYVLATKFSDGDPGDPWAVGFYAGLQFGDRHRVNDGEGRSIRPNGYRSVGRVTPEVGVWLLKNAAVLEASPPGTVNLWQMLTPRARGIDSPPCGSTAKPQEPGPEGTRLEENRAQAVEPVAPAAALKALEFAEYMAKAADEFLVSVTKLGGLQQLLDDGDTVTNEEWGGAQESVGEYMGRLRCAVYGFRKRAAKVTATPQAPAPQAQPPSQEQIAGYLFTQRKPGRVSQFVSIAPEGSEGWPLDTWHTVTRAALVEAGPREEIWRNEKLIDAHSIGQPHGEA